MKNTIETITATANQSKRVFTIRKYINGKLLTKYRTMERTPDEFSDEEMNTAEDWKNFLRSTSDYYAVK